MNEVQYETKEEISRFLQGGQKQHLLIDLEERFLRNSKISFDGVFLSLYSHLLK